MKRVAVVVLIALALAGTWPGQVSKVHADPATVSQLHWIFDGPVRASVRLGNTLYVGGDFTAVAPSANVLPPVFALSDTTGAVIAPTYAIADGNVAAIEPDGSGGYFLGGDFQVTSGGAHVYLAHVLADGSVDGTFAPVLNGPVASLARLNGTLYAAGTFTSIGGVTVPRLGAVSTTTGARAAWDPVLPNSTRPIQVLASVDRVVVTGVDAIPPVQSATATAFDAVSAAQLWSAFIGGGGIRLPDAPTVALVAGARLLVAHTRGFANLSLATGAIDTSWNPQVTPSTMALSGTTLYLAGTFTTVAGQSRAGLAAIDVTTAALLPWNPGDGASISSLAVTGAGDVVVSGSFTTIRGVLRHHLAAIDTAGAVTPWIADARPDTATLVAVPGAILASSSVTATGSVPRSRLAAFDLTSGALLPWAPVSVEGVPFMAATAGRVYAGLSGSVLVLDPTTGAQLDVVSATKAVFAQGPWIYWVTTPPGETAPVLRRVDLATSGTDASWRPATFLPDAIAQDGDTLYFASATAGLSAVDARSARVRWTNPGVGARQVVTNGDTLVVSDLIQVRVVDARTGVAMGTWPSTFPLAIAGADGRVMVGSISSVFSVDPALSARTTAGAPVSWGAALSGRVDDLMVTGGLLVAGGEFATRTPQALRGLAVFPLLGAKAPTNLRARPKGTATEFTWDAPANPPAGYVIEAGLASGQTLGTLPIGNVTSFSLDVPPGSYYVRVRTAGAVGGTEELSNEVLVRGGCSAPPLPPTALAAAVNGSTLSLSWTAPDALVSTYVLSAGSAPGLSDIATVPLSGATTTVSGAVPAGSYFVRVLAVNACGASAPTSDIRVVMGAADALPGAPSAPVLTSLGGLPALQWTAPPGSVTGYVLEVGSDIGLSDLGTATQGPFTNFTLAFSIPRGTYIVRVRAVNAAGTGPASPDFVLVR